MVNDFDRWTSAALANGVAPRPQSTGELFDVGIRREHRLLMVEGRDGEVHEARHGRAWMWLLLLPFAALLVPPLYAHEAPHLWGIPFFYWYQAVWLIITAAITTFVYRKVR